MVMAVTSVHIVATMYCASCGTKHRPNLVCVLRVYTFDRERAVQKSYNDGRYRKTNLQK